MQAAATLAALAAAEPGAASELLVQQLDGLQASAEKLAQLSTSKAAAAASAEKQSQPRHVSAYISSPKCRQGLQGIQATVCWHGHTVFRQLSSCRELLGVLATLRSTWGILTLQDLIVRLAERLRQ